MEDALALVREAITRDYFTPNVTAEVIIDCLLTGKLAWIASKLCGRQIRYVAKEMSIPYLAPRKNNLGRKIDYVLADDDFVYLTELKTTPSSSRHRQIEHYAGVCERWKFGESLGMRLLSILAREFGKGEISARHRNDGGFAWLYAEIMERGAMPYGNAAAALEKVRNGGFAWTPGRRSGKYLLTLGEVLDYLADGERGLWDREMRIIYLAPGNPATALDSPYVAWTPTLEEAASVLEGEKDEYSRFLAATLRGILPEKT